MPLTLQSYTHSGHISGGSVSHGKSLFKVGIPAVYFVTTKNNQEQFPEEKAIP